MQATLPQQRTRRMLACPNLRSSLYNLGERQRSTHHVFAIGDAAGTNIIAWERTIAKVWANTQGRKYVDTTKIIR